MRIHSIPRQLVWLFLALLTWLPPSTGLGEEQMGGITFIGDRQGVCVSIESECLDKTIDCQLDTCDENQVVREQFRDRTPFTLLVPRGEHRLVIMKDGREVVSETITISPEQILEYKLP
ncbi:MAG TPA: hypothetical protein DDY20_07875 [Desulfobulbaceae bacterium]|nr:hypothetical protein [Desulfobulbaceae bacterium]